VAVAPGPPHAQGGAHVHENELILDLTPHDVKPVEERKKCGDKEGEAVEAEEGVGV
jgi:hypothetical protein